MTRAAHTLSLNDLCYSTSSVLVPSRLMSHFNRRVIDCGSRRLYLNHLVQSYLPYLHLFEKALRAGCDDKWKTVYQVQDQSLIKRNFVPEPHDWEVMRHVALAAGVSICFLFVFLMQLEINQIYFEDKQEYPVNGNSFAKRPNNIKKFKKYSKLWRTLDRHRQELTRKHQN